MSQTETTEPVTTSHPGGFSKTQKRVAIGAAALVLIILFAVPAINVNRYRLSVSKSLSQALGRNVTVQSISMQTFPQPGLLLNGVVVDDDPTISAEPILRADQVLATLRLSSLWRGRLEIGTLKLNYPSLNLARANDGRWNIAWLLERARQTPSAPTAKTRPETRARFPYIESNGGRINLKIGNEKKVFAFSDADFGVWMASEDEWRMRLEARPIRTDANLSDTGTLKVEGSWRRAPQLHETPIFVRFWWDYGQLGQITHLIYGRDRGWRGGVHVSGTVSGKPEDLAVRLDAHVEDFRRYDIMSGESVSLELHCDSDYNFTGKQLHNLACQMPAGSGVVFANGSYEFLPTPKLDLSITAENVPMQFLALLARHAKRDMPSDMNVSGMLSASIAVKGVSDQRLWTGNGEVSAVQIRSTVLSSPLVIAPSRWILTGPGTDTAAAPAKHAKGKKAAKDVPFAPASLAWRLEPVTVKLGTAPPVMLAGWFSHTGYYSELHGELDLEAVFQLARLAGLPTPASEVTGEANGAVQVSGAWAGFSPATMTGDAQLKNVTVKFAGIASPLYVSAAHFTATSAAFQIGKASGRFAGIPAALEFSGMWPQHCSATSGESQLDCELQFNVSAGELDVDEINSLLNPRAQKRPWYAALAHTVLGQQRAKFPEIYARGHVNVATLLVKTVAVGHFSTGLTIVPAGFSLTNISADIFGGEYSGELTSDFKSDAPEYTLTGKLQNVAMTSVATAMKDSWATGTATISCHGKASGWNADELLSSASGSATFDWLNGSLPHVELDSTPKSLQFATFSGSLGLSQGVVTIEASKLQSSGGIYLVNGTASLGRRLELQLSRENQPLYSISGTLEKPQVARLKVPVPQAKLRQSVR